MAIGTAAMGLLVAGLSLLVVRGARRGGDEAPSWPAVEPSRLHAGPLGAAAAGPDDVELFVRRLGDEDPAVRPLSLRALAGVRAGTGMSRTDRALAESARAGTSAGDVGAVRYVDEER